MHPLAAETWGPGSPELRPGGHRDARRTVEAYAPRDAHQARERERILAFLDRHGDALERTCVPGHLTASALVLDGPCERGLLTLHRKLGKWLQLGGHCDGDGNLAASALREAVEESGIAELRVHPTPVDLDIHEIPARGSEPAHLHLDVRFAIFAPNHARFRVSEESLDLGWFDPHELAVLDGVDDSVRRLYELLLSKRTSSD